MDERGEYIKNQEVSTNDNKYPTGMRFVGYKHGSEKQMANASTKLLFTTDGWVKMNILGNDANLSKYGGVIVDEVHERSVNIDIVIALLMDIIKRRPDFKVIFVSATMDLELFYDYLKRIGLENAYSTYTLPESKAPFKRTLVKDAKRVDSMQLVDTIYRKINDIILNPQLPPGNILAFVTSESEAGKIKKKIDKNMKTYPINNKPFPIAFTRMTNQREQELATSKNSLQTVNPTPDAPQGFARKVIIGTNVVESSVTFDDPIVYVIESGLAFEKIYDAKNYCFKTGKFDIAKASIDQRCGRTGRTCDGTCYQLYRQSDFDKLSEFTPPKILQEDITSDFLNIIIMPMNGNLQRGLEFLTRMIEPTKNYQPAIYRAYNNLLNMDMIDAAGNITPLGKICNSFNKFDLKIAKMIVGSIYLQCSYLAIPLGAILQTVMGFDDIFYRPPGMEDDPALERQYEANIRRLKDDRGDHMTLLRLYYLWTNSPDRAEFAEQNGLNTKILNDIQKAEKDLMKEALNASRNLAGLNLFILPNQNSIQNPKVQSGGGLDDFKPLLFDGEVDYEEDEDDDLHSQSGGTSSGEYESDSSDEELDAIKLPDTSEIDGIIQEMYGGNLSRLSGLEDADSSSINKTRLLLDISSGAKDAASSTTYFQDYNSNINLYDFTGSYGGGRYNDDSRLFRTNKKGRMQTRKNNNQYQSNNYNRRKKHGTLISSLVFEKKYLEGGAKPTKQVKIEKPDDVEVKKRLERNRKIMEVITLKGLPQQKTLSIPSDDINRLHAALYYGYSNNIASYSGSSKKYWVKFSPEKASISKTTFDYNTTNPTPAWVIYHEFSITKIPGRPDDAKLSIVSELKQQDFLTFLDINEIRKQL